MSEDRFPEITACNAAKMAVEEFDSKHAAKATAIKAVAKMLERGGWGAVRLDDSRPLPPGHFTQGDEGTASRAALSFIQSGPSGAFSTSLASWGLIQVGGGLDLAVRRVGTVPVGFA